MSGLFIDHHIVVSESAVRAPYRLPCQHHIGGIIMCSCGNMALQGVSTQSVRYHDSNTLQQFNMPCYAVLLTL